MGQRPNKTISSPSHTFSCNWVRSRHGPQWAIERNEGQFCDCNGPRRGPLKPLACQVVRPPPRGREKSTGGQLLRQAVPRRCRSDLTGIDIFIYLFVINKTFRHAGREGSFPPSVFDPPPTSPSISLPHHSRILCVNSDSNQVLERSCNGGGDAPSC